jgi:hypothetical protein
MKTVALSLVILVAYSTFAHQDGPQIPAQSVAFFDVLDLPARIDEPKLQKTANDYALKCALANRSGERLVGLRLAVLLVDKSSGRMTRATWNEATDVAAYSIRTFEFHSTIKADLEDANVFLAIDEVTGRDTIWRTVEAEKLLRAYARGQHGQIPRVQKLQNKYDKEAPRILSSQPKLPRP